MPPRSTPRRKERDLLERFPPDRLEVVRETDVTESLRERLDRMEQRGQRHLLAVPPDVLRRAIVAAREKAGDRTITYHRVEALATWSAGRLPASA
jgi:hypothetical protein